MKYKIQALTPIVLFDELEKMIVIDRFNKSHSSNTLFTVLVEDNSMQPELNVGDLIVIDGELPPKPGDLVLAYLPAKKQAVLRQYGETNRARFNYSLIMNYGQRFM